MGRKYNKYQIGENVELINGNIGEVGEIIEIEDSSTPYKVEFKTADQNEDYLLWLSESQLELY